MPLIPFPNVPALAGVPALPRRTGLTPAARISLGILQNILLSSSRAQSQWGIFDKNGTALGDPNQFIGLNGKILNELGQNSRLSTGSFDYSKETRVSEFPIERGGFASYNKVETPASSVVTMCFTGSEKDRTLFLEAIDAACKSTELYSVATPEKNYINYSIESYNYQRRSDRGTTLFIVEISLKEIRQVSAAYAQSNKGQIEQPKNVSATPQVNGGKVQAQTPIASTLKSIVSKLTGAAN